MVSSLVPPMVAETVLKVLGKNALIIIVIIIIITDNKS